MEKQVRIKFIDRFGRKYSQYKYDKDSLGFIAVYNNNR